VDLPSAQAVPVDHTREVQVHQSVISVLLGNIRLLRVKVLVILVLRVLSSHFLVKFLVQHVNLVIIQIQSGSQLACHVQVERIVKERVLVVPHSVADARRGCILHLMLRLRAHHVQQVRSL